MNSGRSSQKLGDAGEQLARHALAQLGLERIKRIHTGWKVIRFLKAGIAQIVPHERVDGDFTAIDPRTGKAVLIECKWRGEKLRYSDLAAHQIEALNEYCKHGALAYIVWININNRCAYVLPWPCLQPRQSLTDEQAAARSVQVCYFI